MYICTAIGPLLHGCFRTRSFGHGSYEWYNQGALMILFVALRKRFRGLFTLTITHWRVPHFHLMHRAIHPWRTTTVPDLGKFLYRHVHAQHHKSYLPTAFSGTNMHPVEATLHLGFVTCLRLFCWWFAFGALLCQMISAFFQEARSFHGKPGLKN